ncbi:hypothetical protein [Culicoidibacter larvae]|uniref:Uncharacterized protein n=1 Tax=Culicoidibacter larvae TaxID=2579976 RepID=A0A5R8Q8R5_9FIRM|nr:hypothetical protein [Culicoidibacter larvae]TLG72104.1 hypothetical protein FEZ08_09740 [Culicoidibacter larvae]
MNIKRLKLETIIISVLGVLLRIASIIFYLQIINLYDEAIITVPLATIIVLVLTFIEAAGFIYAIIWALRVKPASKIYAVFPMIVVGMIGIGNWAYYLISSSNPLNVILNGTLSMLPSLALVIIGILYCSQNQGNTEEM